MISKDIDIDLLAGQRLMVGFEGTGINSELKALIKDIKVSGIILFAGNIESAEQVKELSLSVQDYASSCDLPPLFIAVDQEGGEVARLKKPDFTEFSGNPHITDIDSATNFATVTANELKSVHINMDLAPVMDIIPETEGSCDGFKSIMANRVFPGNPEKVGKLGSCIIETLQQNGIMAVAKHFPGIGRTTRDSHLELPILDAERKLMESSDFIPFMAAIKSDVAAIMLSHILYTDLDSKWPASLSFNIAKTVLRDQMGYHGVVMTDDLDMKAIKCDIKTSIRQILNAQVDITLICHKGPSIENAFQQIKSLISNDDELYRKGLESSHRIASLKRKYIGDF
ncbi:MAG: beta-N-acetylhexosaminidase [Desulfamplus sp.]|nr:beta-N-acetylhexosaminidase [Desulfamplus sp.]